MSTLSEEEIIKMDGTMPNGPSKAASDGVVWLSIALLTVIAALSGFALWNPFHL